MDSLIQIFIDALGQGYGRHNTPGWVYLLATIISVVSAISAKEFAKKRKALRESKTHELTTQDLRASLISQENEGAIKYSGLLKKEANSYRLIIEAMNNEDTHVVADVTKNSLNEIAEYLRSKTKFILADFK